MIKQLFSNFATSNESTNMLDQRHKRMELKEGLEFYRKCLQDCDRVITDLYHQDLPKERKQALIDKLLITRNKLVKTIERIEELLR